MPTVFIQNGFEVRIRTRDHPPPHVHICKAGEEIKINIGNDVDPPEIVRQKMNPTDARRAIEIVENNQSLLLEKWREIYGRQDFRRAI
jgi:hypothetical protein